MYLFVSDLKLLNIYQLYKQKVLLFMFKDIRVLFTKIGW